MEYQWSIQSIVGVRKGIVRTLRAGDRVERIADVLRRDIVSGSLSPGEALRQEVLAARFDASRMPVREALRTLEADGLVLLAPNKGAVVAPLDRSELQEVYEMRIAAEVLALRTAIPELTNRTLDAAEAIQNECERAPLSEFGSHNKRFHLCLYAPCGRPRLLHHIRQLGDVADRYLRFTAGVLGHRERSDAEHRNLLSTMRARDAEASVRVLTEHISAAGERLLKFLDSPGGTDADANKQSWEAF